jgi:cell volume regulation protein A
LDFANHAVLIGALLVVLSILASVVARRTGAPLLLVFLSIGMLAGAEGPGGIVFDSFEAAYLVGTMALAIILLDGGMRTRAESSQVGLRPALSLATVGVLITTGIVGLAASWILDFDWRQGLLIGAIIGSTDAAAVFSLLHSRGMHLKQRVGTTLEIESGCNDPMAIFLTLAFVTAVQSGSESIGANFFVTFIYQFGIGALFGVGGGRALAWLISRVHLTVGLYPLLAAAGGLTVYGATTIAGGSGFLAIYITGLVLGNTRMHASNNIRRVHDGLAWLAQITLFLMLGLLVTPSALIPMWHVGLFIAAVLTFVARPLAVWVSLLPFRFPWREQVFISWVGLRGAVPIVLATFPVLGGVENGALYFNIAFFVVLTSLLIQGWTVAPLARKFRLRLPSEHAPYYSESLEVPDQSDLMIVGYRIAAESPAIGRHVGDLMLPEDARVAAAFRNGRAIEALAHFEVEAGDFLYVITSQEHAQLVDRALVPMDDAEESEQAEFFGSFMLNGDAKIDEVADVYGVMVPPNAEGLTLAEYLDREFHTRCVVGDRVYLGPLELVVREMKDEQVFRVGVRVVRDED